MLLKKQLVGKSASTFPTFFFGPGIAMASSFGNHTVLPRRVIGFFFDSLWDSLGFCFLVEKFPAFLRGFLRDGYFIQLVNVMHKYRFMKQTLYYRMYLL